MPSTPFAYDPAILERYPTIVGGVLHARSVVNGPTPAGLVEAFAAEQTAVLARIGSTPLSEVPSLAAWRRAFRAFGVDPTQYRSAAEALLRRLTKQGSIPAIDCLVDLGNLVSIRYALPVAVFDLGAIRGGITVRFAAGDERFTELGAESDQHPEPGEVIFLDEAGRVSARRWCWRQDARSAAGPGTSEILVTIEGLHPDASRDVAAATADLAALLRAYANGSDIRSAVLGVTAPWFPA